MTSLKVRGGILLSIGVLALASSAMALPKNSYITRPVKSVADLTNHIATTNVVADRYMRHFSMTKAEVLEYVGSLHLASLTEQQSMLVYGVPVNGQIHATRQTLPKGDRLLVDRYGNPVLRLVCGNPVTLGPKKPYAMNVTKGTPIAAATPDLVPVAAMPEGTDITNSTSIIAMEPSITPLAPAEVVTEASAPSVILPTAASGNPFPLLIPLALAGTTGRGGNPTPVPEPMSMIALGGGVAAVLAKKRKK